MDRYLAGQLNNLAFEVAQAEKKRLKPLSFAIGTEVALTKRTSPSWKSWLKSDEALIITNADPSENGLQYSVNGCSWFDHDELTFIAEPTKKSIRYACQTCTDADADPEEDSKGRPIKRKEVRLTRSKAAVAAMKGLKLKRKEDWQ